LGEQSLDPLVAVEAVEAAATLPFEEGLRRERELFMQCMASPQRAALTYAFFGEREVAKVPGLSEAARPRPVGSVAIVGAAMGTAHVGWPTIARECEVFIPQGGSIPDLLEVVSLAESGALVSDVEEFPFAEVDEAYARLRAGDVVGRAVVVMP
jgi:D-arabinose 1-dehydrogenase-like Zn-dependent alcohol dehydrogenase